MQPNCNALNVKAVILAELAFMTNEKEASKYMGSGWQVGKATINALSDGKIE